LGRFFTSFLAIYFPSLSSFISSQQTRAYLSSNSSNSKRLLIDIVKIERKWAKLKDSPSDEKRLDAMRKLQKGKDWNRKY
jgi:hypothetical protein